jgi:hypothetical protein
MPVSLSGGVRGEFLITQQLVCGKVRNSSIAMRSDQGSPVDLQFSRIARTASDH